MGDFEITISEAEIIAAALEIAMEHTSDTRLYADFEAVLELIERHIGE